MACLDLVYPMAEWWGISADRTERRAKSEGASGGGASRAGNGYYTGGWGSSLALIRGMGRTSGGNVPSATRNTSCSQGMSGCIQMSKHEGASR